MIAMTTATAIADIQARLEAQNYICNSSIATSLFLAQALDKPLLIEGPPGVGKTELAKAAAAMTGKPLIRLQCYEGLDETKALYEWKYGKQLLYTQLLKDNEIRISMDGKGCWRDNVFVERLWKSVKYEEVYLKAYDSVSDAKANLGVYLDFFNTRRPHQSLDGKTPDTIYYAGLPQQRIAA